MASVPSPATVTAFELYRQIIAETDDLPSVIGELAALNAMAQQRMSRGTALAPSTTPESPTEALLDVTEAAALIGVERKWLLRNTQGKKFRRNLSRKVVKFDKAGLLRWVTKIS